MACNCGSGVRSEPAPERTVQPVLNFEGTMKEFLEQNGWTFIGQSCACQNALLMYRHDTLTPKTGLFINITKDNNNLRILTAQDKYIKGSYGLLNWQEGYNTYFS